MKAKRLDLRATFLISSCGFVLSEAMGPLRFINWTGAFVEKVVCIALPAVGDRRFRCMRPVTPAELTLFL
jgi:hypothetical protein